MNKQIIVVTGASSGFGALTARQLALAGHNVFAGMRGTTGRNAPQVEAVAVYATEHGVDLRAVELDVQSDASVEAGIAQIIADCGRLDVVIHNAGHMSFGPAEAFTPKQFADLYGINMPSTQRVNRAALPQLRKKGKGLVLWVSSSSARGATPPYLSPYFAAKPAMDSLAVSYADELARWGVETSIIVPGAFTSGTNHFTHSGKFADEARTAEYANGPGADIPDTAMKGLPVWSLPTPMLLVSSLPRTASVRSASTSIHRRTARRRQRHVRPGPCRDVPPHWSGRPAHRPRQLTGVEPGRHPAGSHRKDRCYDLHRLNRPRSRGKATIPRYQRCR